MKTKVKFLIEKPEDNYSGEVFAFFPDDNYTNFSTDTKTCYAHTGQHSACHIDYAGECKEATPEQYNDLKNELTGIGYKLEILTGDKLPGITLYRKFLNIASLRFNITIDKCRDKYGMFTVNQWEHLLN